MLVEHEDFCSPAVGALWGDRKALPTKVGRTHHVLSLCRMLSELFKVCA